MSMMKRRLLFALVLMSVALYSCQSSFAQKATPEERVIQIADASSLVKAGSKPWHLRMTFQLFDLKGNHAEQGTIEEWWAGQGAYRRVVTSPSYNQTIPGQEDQASSSRRTRYLVDLLIDQVIDPVPHYGDFKGLNVTEGKRRVSKVELTCYNVLQNSPSYQPPTHPEFCVDEGMNDLRIRFDTGSFVAIRNHIGKFRGVQLGLDNSLSYAARQAISGHVETLESYDPAKLPVELTHPSEESPSAIPGVVLAGKVRKKEQPVYPMIAKQEHIGGTVILTAIISKQGTIASLEVVASPDDSLSEASIAAVKHWTYDPYLLNGQPTEVDTTITVNFNIN